MHAARAGGRACHARLSARQSTLVRCVVSMIHRGSRYAYAEYLRHPPRRPTRASRSIFGVRCWWFNTQQHGSLADRGGDVDLLRMSCSGVLGHAWPAWNGWQQSLYALPDSQTQGSSADLGVRSVGSSGALPNPLNAGGAFEAIRSDVDAHRKGSARFAGEDTG